MYKQTNTMEHCQCDWQGVQSDADNTEESITSSTTGRRIAKTCLCTNTNVTLHKYKSLTSFKTGQRAFHIAKMFVNKYKCNFEYKYKSITSSTTGRRIAKTCLYKNTNATLNTNTNPLPASKQDLPHLQKYLSNLLL